MGEYYGRLSIKPYKRDGKQIGWRGSMDYYHCGKRKQKTKICREKSKKAARLILEAWRDEENKDAKKAMAINGGVFYNRKNNEPTVSEMCLWYINRQLELGEIEKSTYSKNYEYYTNYVFPYLGDIIYTEIDKVSLESWLTKLHNRGLGENTIHTAYAVLNKVYRYSAKSGDISHNPCEYVKTPKKGDAKVTYLDKPQMNKLLKCLDVEYDEGHYMRAAVKIALYGGLRRGEICGLRWRDVDFDMNTISVSSAIGVYRDEEGTATYTKQPKNLTSVRKFPMPKQLKNALKERYDAVKKKVGAVIPQWFVVGDVNTYRAPTTLTREFERFTEKYNIREHFGRYATLHCLRHNLATIGVQSNMDIASLTEMMGHASKAMTLDTYSSATPDAMAMATKKLSDSMDNIIEE